MATRRTFGKTWWGNAWVEAMEMIDYNTNRLPRGKRYANKGMVREIKIKNGDVLARVKGTRPSPYRVKISLKKFSAEQIRKIKSIIAGDPALASELALGRLPEEMLVFLEKQKIYLLPTAWSDLSAGCSCPDWANPCKHLAAVYYIIANEIDKDPFIIFNLRGISTDDLMQAAGFASKACKGMERDFFTPYAEVIAEAGEQSSEPDLSFQKTELTAIFSLLATSPLFYPEGDFKKILLKAYKNIANSLEELSLLEDDLSFKEANFCLIYPSKKIFYPLPDTAFFAFPADKLPDVCQGKAVSMSIPVQLDKLEIKKNRGKTIKTGTLLDLFLKLPLSTTLDNCSPSARFLNVATTVAQALARSASFAPEIVSDQEGNFFVRYIPLAHSENIEAAIDYLVNIMPAGFIFRKEDKRVLMGKDGVYEVLSLILSHIVSHFSNIEQKDKLCNAFFRGAPYTAEGFDEKQTAKNISSWLERLHLRERDISPVIRIEMPKRKNDGFKLQIDVENKRDPLAPLLPLSKVFGTQKQIFSRPAEVTRIEVAKQIAIAAEYMPALKDILSSKGKKSLSINSLVMAEFLDNAKEVFNLLGIRIIIPKELKKLASPRIAMAAKCKGERVSYLSLDEMLSFSWEITVGDLILTKEEFLKLASSAEGIVKFKDQYLLLRPDEVKNIINRLNKPFPKLSPGELIQASLTGEARGVLFNSDAVIKRMLDELTQVEQIRAPGSLKANLRPYQKRGFQWLYSNISKGLGSCLADDMGLGKTIQVIAVLLKLKEDNQLKSPALVICPTTLIGNWVKECAKFAPSLKISVYHGTERRMRTSNTDILITTYGLIRRDLKKFKDKVWDLLVIDEAQNIKNHDSAQTRAVKSLRANAYIAMSGTPVENRLSELWSIFDFMNRGYFGSLQDFIRRFAMPIEKYRDRERIATLKKATAPFILRRLKTDKSIIKDLPDKAIFNKYCYLTREQAAMYQQVVDATLKEIQASEGITRRGLIFKLLTSLKQICNHPVHYTKKGKIAKDLSGKAQKAISLLERVIAAREKALLFTQYKEMGDLLVEMIAKELKEETLFFHGGLSRARRDKMIEDFQNSARYPVLIISLKAGGTGLNLTAATNVIHYDLWWNPAVEAQATDRAFRIGQTKKVVVYRLITLGTFEEKIDEMLNSKKELAELTVLTGEQWLTELSDRELLEIFKLAR